MGVIDTLNISASGLTAQRLRMDLIAQNIANASTTRGADGEPYRRRTLVFAERTTSSFESILFENQSNYSYAPSFTGRGVRVTGIVEDHVNEMRKVYDPAHPDSDEDGYVTYPNVNPITEMTNLIDATRAYEANVTAMNATKSMLLKTLEIGQ